MKREVFLAVAVGFVLGLIITFGIWTANNNLHKYSRPAANQDIIPSPTGAQSSGQPAEVLPLSFTAPADDETLVNSDSLTITGKTAPGSVVAIMYESGQDLVTADKEGNFTLDIKLDSGYNRITTTAFDKNGNTAQIHTLVTYSTNKI